MYIPKDILFRTLCQGLRNAPEMRYKHRMTYEHWTIQGLPWDELSPGRVDPDTLAIIKAAALVEYNARDYADYLCRVFADDAALQTDINRWAEEEVQHGAALGAWAGRIDPSWDFNAAMARFRTGYKIDHFANDNAESVRGSRSGELVARCMVEVGTSSYYTAIGRAVEEPVLKQICRHIAGDEFRHYKLFYDAMKRYLATENLGRFGRLKVALGRIAESEDDELAYAYYAANAPADAPYDRKTYNREYTTRAYRYYGRAEVDRAISMVFKACGFKPNTLPHRMATGTAWWLLSSKRKAA